MSAHMRALHASAGQVTSALNSNTAATNSNTSAMGRLSNSTRQAGQNFNSAASQLQGFNRGLGQLKGLIAGGIVVSLGKEIVDTAFHMEGAKRALEALTGSVALGAAQFEKLDEMADRVGYRTLDLTKSYVKLQGAVAGTNLEGATSEKLFENLARATAMYGGSTDDLDGSLTALVQMASKGTVQMEELKGQLGDRLPGALRIAADAMGVTSKELSKMVKDGKLDADVFFRKFGDELGTKVPAGFESARASVARFQNTWDKAKLAFASSGFLKGVTDGLSALGKSLTDNKDSIEAFGKTIGSVLTFLAENIKVVGQFAGALIALNVASTVVTSLIAMNGVLVVLRTSTIATTGAMVALRAAMTFLTGPWGLAIGVITAAVTALHIAQSKAVQPTKDAKTATEALDKALKGYEETARLAANATGKDREALLNSLAAKKAAIQHEKALAEAKLATARATLIAAQVQVTTAMTSTWGGAGAGSEAANAGAANTGRRVGAQAKADVDLLKASVENAKTSLADLDKTIAALKAPKVDLGGGGGSDGKGDKSAKAAADAIKKYNEELTKLKLAADQATMSERDLAAAQALESAGLKQNIKATDERSVAIIAAAQAAYDAKKAVEDKKSADELDIQTTNRLVQAQNDLLALTNPALAASKSAIDAANAEYAATMKQITALTGLTEARRAELAAKAAQQRDTVVATANGEAGNNNTEFARGVTRSAEDAAIDGRAITDPKGAEEERQQLEIQRRREDGIRLLGENIDKNSALYAELLASINSTADKELENLDKLTKQSKAVTTIKQMSDLLGGLFTNTKETMKQFFSQMISQLLQTIAYALIMKTTMKEAFSAMGSGGGGGLAGSIVGAIFGARANGGPISANKPYLVGERGPELILPGKSGTVIPNGALAGGGSGGGFTMGNINNHITINGGGPEAGQQAGLAAAQQTRKVMEDIVEKKFQQRGIR